MTFLKVVHFQVLTSLNLIIGVCDASLAIFVWNPESQDPLIKSILELSIMVGFQQRLEFARSYEHSTMDITLLTPTQLSNVSWSLIPFPRNFE